VRPAVMIRSNRTASTRSIWIKRASIIKTATYYGSLSTFPLQGTKACTLAILRLRLRQASVDVCFRILQE
jgi:hypothetical protein